MKRFLKKSLIYLLAFTIAVPAWLITGITSAQHAKAYDGQSELPKIIINEYLTNPLVGEDEWIELLNTTNEDIDLTEWTIKDAANNSKLLSSLVLIPAKSIVVFSSSSGWLNNSGLESITISDQQSEVIDTVQFGDISLGNPSQGKSNSLINNIWSSNTETTKGLPNVEEIDTTVPVIAIELPLNDTYVGKTIPVKVSTEDQDIEYYSLEIRRNSDNGLVYTMDLLTPLENNEVYLWDTLALDENNNKFYPDGIYTLVLEAEDEAGNIGSDTVQVTVDNTAPTVDLLADNNLLLTQDLSAWIAQSPEDKAVLDAAGYDYTKAEISLIPLNSVYTDPGYTVFDNFEFDVLPSQIIKYTTSAEGVITPDQVLEINTVEPALYQIIYLAADKAGNVGLNTRFILVDDSVNDDPENPTLDITLVVDGNGKLVYSVKANLLDDSNQLLGMVEMPAGTTIENWTGTLNLPRLVDLGTVKLNLDQHNVSSDMLAFEVGAGATPITFDKPVKITILGAAGKRVGYVKNGEFVEITSKCGVDDTGALVMPDEIANECKIDSVDGKDLIVLTKHFTTFVTYSQVELKAPDFTTTTVTRDGANYLQVNWTGLGGGVDYEIFIDGNSKLVVDAKADLAGKSYSKEFKVDYGTYSITIKTKKDGVYSSSTAKILSVAKPVVTAPIAETTPTIAPAKAKAATNPEPTVEEKKDDSKGVIKGDESTKDEEESVNWTPWIILFVLIVLAGAATGGYFYWFAGKEEMPAESKKSEIKEIKKDNVAVRVTSKKQQKKTKRW